jgi:hypothetical protein
MWCYLTLDDLSWQRSSFSQSQYEYLIYFPDAIEQHMIATVCKEPSINPKTHCPVVAHIHPSIAVSRTVPIPPVFPCRLVQTASWFNNSKPPLRIGPTHANHHTKNQETLGSCWMDGQLACVLHTTTCCSTSSFLTFSSCWANRNFGRVPIFLIRGKWVG